MSEDWGSTEERLVMRSKSTLLIMLNKVKYLM